VGSRTFHEKRDFRRMDLGDCPFSFRLVEGGETGQGTVTNLSGSGMLLTMQRELPPGTLMAVKLAPQQALVPPFTAVVEVVRAQPLDGCGYRTAVVIKSRA